MKTLVSLFSLVTLVAVNSGCGDPSSAQEPRVVTRQQPTTRLYVRTVPRGAKILIDGKAKGESDQLFTVPADVKRVTVEVELDGSRGRKEVAVRGGEVTRVEFDLRKPAATRPAAVAAASDDTIIESQVLGQAFAELLAESMAARQQAGRPVPAEWNTPQFVPTMLGRLKEEVPGCLDITAAEERKLAAGQFDDAAGEVRVRAALETLRQYDAGLPPIHQFLIERFQKGKLRGAGLVFTARMMEATAAKVAATAPAEPPPTPPDDEVSVTTIGQVYKSPPVVVQTVPPSGDVAVDPGLTEIRVTFSKTMTDGSWSWSQLSDDTFPQSAGQPKYLPDGRTCALPVRLSPGRTYAIWLNSRKFTGFRDAQGNPAVPYLLIFETRK